MSTTDIAKRIRQYVALRDKINEIKERHKKELEPYNETLEQLNAALLALLNSTNGESVRTTEGTAYKKRKTSATIADGDAFRMFVITQGAWDLVDWKANVTAVSDFIEAQAKAAETDPTVVPSPPPGINWSVRYEAGVRRPTTSGAK